MTSPSAAQMAARSAVDLWSVVMAEDNADGYDACRELGHRTDPAITGQALTWLTDPDPLRRRAAVSVLSTTDENSRPRWWSSRDTLVPTLIAAAEVEDDDGVIEALTTALGFFEAIEAVPWMIGVLSGDRPDWVRDSACRSLDTFIPAVPAAVAAVEAALDDSSALVRDWASFAFTNTTASTPTLADTLLRHVDDDADVVRVQVIDALALRGDRRVLPHLAAALLDPPEEDPELLEQAATHLPDPQLLPGLLHYRSLRTGGDPALDALIASLR